MFLGVPQEHGQPSAGRQCPKDGPRQELWGSCLQKQGLQRMAESPRGRASEPVPNEPEGRAQWVFIETAGQSERRNVTLRGVKQELANENRGGVAWAGLREQPTNESLGAGSGWAYPWRSANPGPAEVPGGRALGRLSNERLGRASWAEPRRLANHGARAVTFLGVP